MRTRTATIRFGTLCGTLVLSFGGCGGVVDEQAEEQFRAALGHTSITVFPAFVRTGEQKRYDAAAARQIADFLSGAELATTTVATAEVPVTSQWGMNQARMFRESVADFQEYIRANPPQTTYALLPEYLIDGQGGVVGVHFYVLDANGTCASGALLNSHHQAFNEVDPKSADDCTRIVLNVLRAELKPAGP